jgi:hypothetical protein
MRDLSELERRIERLQSRASRGPLNPRLVDEIEDVLAEGYVLALRCDARGYRLAEQVDALAIEVDEAPIADEVRRLVRERRTVERTANRLRARLGTLRSLVARAGAARTWST